MTRTQAPILTHSNILQYSYTFEQIHKHATKYKDYKNVHEDNYVFFPQTSESRETHSGGNLTIMFGGLGVACWPLVPKFAGSNPAELVGFLKGEKILSTPSFGGEVKPSVPCRRFAACKRS